MGALYENVVAVTKNHDWENKHRLTSC